MIPLFTSFAKSYPSLPQSHPSDTIVRVTHTENTTHPAPPDTTHRPLAFRWLGRIDYEEALALQYQLAGERAAGQIPDTVLLLEHSGVITMGRRATEAHILADRAELQREGIRVHRVTRGGEVTYHGRGQLVGYIIFDIRSRIKQVAALMHGIEQALVAFLGNEYGITAASNPRHPGVWVKRQDAQSVTNGKIAAVGVSIQSGITIHGFALNISTDLRHFAYIVACGINDLRHSSLAEELQRQTKSRRGDGHGTATDATTAPSTTADNGAGDAPTNTPPPRPPELAQAATQLQPYLAQMHTAFFTEWHARQRTTN